MDFEFDALKSSVNKTKHGIDFMEAQQLWNDDNAIIINARSQYEERFLVIGLIGEIFWSAVIAYRNGCIRIISVRRSRMDERGAYDKQNDISPGI